MAQFSGRQRLLPPEVLDTFKYEIANELGLTEQIQSKGWPEMTSRDCGRVGGRIGGRMVRVMVRFAQQQMAAGATTS